MARTNIEESAWRRIFKLARLLDVPVASATGVCALLWMESQDVLRISGSYQEILEWAHLDDMDDEDNQQLWVNALIKSRIISPLHHQDEYLIHGNETQIENLISLTSRAAKGGAANKRRWEERKKRELGDSLSSINDELADSHNLKHKIAQFNAIQGNAKQCNANNNSISEVVKTSPRSPVEKVPKFNHQVNSIAEVLGQLSPKTLESWAQLYPDQEFIERELIKAFAYYVHDNPKKCPKSRSGWSRSLASWLARGWDWRAKQTPGKGSDGLDEWLRSRQGAAQ